MKTKIVRMLAALVVIAPLLSAAAAESSTTFTSKEAGYLAAITLTNAGKTADGKRAISYRAVLSSKTCHSVIAGTATFFSNTDGAGDDSGFLPNGYAVRISRFKDTGRNGDIELIVDVESIRPRYVYFMLTGAPALPGSCVPSDGVGIGFYSAAAYKPEARQ